LENQCTHDDDVYKNKHEVPSNSQRHSFNYKPHQIQWYEFSSTSVPTSKHIQTFKFSCNHSTVKMQPAHCKYGIEYMYKICNSVEIM